MSGIDELKAAYKAEEQWAIGAEEDPWRAAEAPTDELSTEEQKTDIELAAETWESKKSKALAWWAASEDDAPKEPTSDGSASDEVEYVPIEVPIEEPAPASASSSKPPFKAFPKPKETPPPPKAMPKTKSQTVEAKEEAVEAKKRPVVPKTKAVPKEEPQLPKEEPQPKSKGKGKGYGVFRKGEK